MLTARQITRGVPRELEEISARMEDASRKWRQGERKALLMVVLVNQAASKRAGS
jgi:hypothetical protein